MKPWAVNPPENCNLILLSLSVAMSVMWYSKWVSNPISRLKSNVKVSSNGDRYSFFRTYQRRSSDPCRKRLLSTGSSRAGCPVDAHNKALDSGRKDHEMVRACPHDTLLTLPVELAHAAAHSSMLNSVLPGGSAMIVVSDSRSA